MPWSGATLSKKSAGSVIQSALSMATKSRAVSRTLSSIFRPPAAVYQSTSVGTPAVGLVAPPRRPTLGRSKVEKKTHCPGRPKHRRPVHRVRISNEPDRHHQWTQRMRRTPMTVQRNDLRAMLAPNVAIHANFSHETRVGSSAIAASVPDTLA